MTTTHDLAASVRAALARVGDIREVRMFGGTCFMLDGNMVAGASKRGLLVRVGKQQYESALSRAGAEPMEMGARTMEGYIRVDPSALNDEALLAWVGLALAFVQTLPPKAPSTKRKQTKGKRT